MKTTKSPHDQQFKLIQQFSEQGSRSSNEDAIMGVHMLDSNKIHFSAEQLAQAGFLFVLTDGVRSSQHPIWASQNTSRELVESYYELISDLDHPPTTNQATSILQGIWHLILKQLTQHHSSTKLNIVLVKLNQASLWNIVAGYIGEMQTFLNQHPIFTHKIKSLSQPVSLTPQEGDSSQNHSIIKFFIIQNITTEQLHQLEIIITTNGLFQSSPYSDPKLLYQDISTKGAFFVRDQIKKLNQSTDNYSLIRIPGIVFTPPKTLNP